MENGIPCLSAAIAATQGQETGNPRQSPGKFIKNILKPALTFARQLSIDTTSSLLRSTNPGCLLSGDYSSLVALKRISGQRSSVNCRLTRLLAR